MDESVCSETLQSASYLDLPVSGEQQILIQVFGERAKNVFILLKT